MTGIEQKATVQVDAPFKPEDLRKFLEVVPAEAEVSVLVHNGGDQRDPYPVHYVFSAKWSF